jgi:hypothetical protein
MQINLNVLTEGERFIVEWQYHFAGGFKTALAEAMIRADIHNLARLELGFPDEVQAYRMYTEVSGWWDEVRKKAGII